MAGDFLTRRALLNERAPGTRAQFLVARLPLACSAVQLEKRVDRLKYCKLKSSSPLRRTTDSSRTGFHDRILAWHPLLSL